VRIAGMIEVLADEQDLGFLVGREERRGCQEPDGDRLDQLAAHRLYLRSEGPSLFILWGRERIGRIG
jgi:hypothetical protein